MFPLERIVEAIQPERYLATTPSSRLSFASRTRSSATSA